MEETKELITTDDIRSKVYIIRGQQVMLDKDLAEIYGYDVKRLNEQVKRNINRFPEDFMFQLKTSEITESLKSQIATLNVSKNKRGMHIKKMPFAFTEQGIYMLATVLRGELAEQQSIFIMRTFREMRHYIKMKKLKKRFIVPAVVFILDMCALIGAIYVVGKSQEQQNRTNAKLKAQCDDICGAYKEPCEAWICREGYY